MDSSYSFKCAKVIQNSFFQNFEGVDWRVYKSNEVEHEYLKRNIGFALFGPPTLNNVLGYTTEQAKSICEIYTTMCNNHYLRNTNELFVRIIYICLYFKSDEAEVESVPLFVVKKCEKESGNPCVIFIDNSSRVYKNWRFFLNNNKFPKCIMICPKNGKYSGRIYLNNQGEEDVEVELEFHDSPACGLNKKALNVTDSVGTGVSVVTSITLAVSAIPAVTIAPAILVGAGIGGIGAGLYATGRSIHNLIDRKRHQQTISLSNAESRNSWLSAGVGVLSAGAAGATVVLKAVTRSGVAAGKATKFMFNSLIYANLLGSTANCGATWYSFLEKLIKKEKITVMDVFQLSSSILFFQMSVMNFRTANAIIQETQSDVISQYESSLRSNRHRKVFNKAKLEATRLKGEVAGNAEIIQGIQNIENRDQFFAGMVKVNKNLNKMGAKFTINADGKVEINSVYIVDPIEFNQMTVMNRQVTLNALPASTPGASLSITKPQLEIKIGEIKSFCVSKAIGAVPVVLMNINENADSIAMLLHNFSQEVADRVLDIAVTFLDEISTELEPIKKIHPLANVTVSGIQFLIEYVKHYAKLMHCKVTEAINLFFSKLSMFIRNIVESFKNWSKSQKEKYFSVRNVYIDIKKKQKTREQCSSCKGYYFRS